MPVSTTYNRMKAIKYAMTYAYNPNPNYVYFKGDDCTNFISQCLRAGGAKDDYNPTHPWWYKNNKPSICWSVAASLYWYIKTSTKERKKGIIADTFTIDTFHYKPSRLNILEIGDIVQYRNKNGRIQHTAIITGFANRNHGKRPLITQHTYSATNIPWQKVHPKTIFHHITAIN